MTATPDNELREAIDNIMLKYMQDSGWNGYLTAEVYQSAMREVMQLIQADKTALNESIAIVHKLELEKCETTLIDKIIAKLIVKNPDNNNFALSPDNDRMMTYGYNAALDEVLEVLESMR